MGRSVLIHNKNKFIALLFIALVTFICGCRINKDVQVEKTGAQLWAENCSRCHNMPSPQDTDDDKWETISMHMKIRSNISNNEIKLIKEFLQSANED